MLEGEGDTFWFHLKHEITTVNRMKVISQTENQEPLATRASSAKLTFEGEGDAFWFHLKRKIIMANRTKAISQTENQELLDHRS